MVLDESAVVPIPWAQASKTAEARSVAIMGSERALRVPNTSAWQPAGAREAATGAEEVAAFDDAGAGDARHLGSSHTVSSLLDAPDEALNVLIASAR